MSGRVVFAACWAGMPIKAFAKIATPRAAHRLIKTQDDQGNTLSYTLDAIGNRIKEEAYDPGGQLARSQSRVYDALSRLQNLVLPQ